MENTEKSSTKWKTCKIKEKSIFVTENRKYQRKSLFLEYSEVQIIIKNLRFVKLLLKFNKNFIVYISHM